LQHAPGQGDVGGVKREGAVEALQQGQDLGVALARILKRRAEELLEELDTLFVDAVIDSLEGDIDSARQSKGGQLFQSGVWVCKPPKTSTWENTEPVSLRRRSTSSHK
jgi:hypothetical protein